MSGGRAKSAELLTGRSAEGLARWVADVLAELLLRQLAFSLILLKTEYGIKKRKKWDKLL